MPNDETPGEGHNSGALNDDMRRKWWKACLKTQQEIEKASEIVKSAKSAHSQVLKDAKAAGLSAEAINGIKQALKKRHKDQDELIREQREEARFLAISGLWPSIQTSLFPSEVPEVEYTSDVAASVAYDNGYQAGVKGELRTVNPHHAGTEQFDAFERGWLAGQTKNVPGGKRLTKKQRREAAEQAMASPEAEAEARGEGADYYGEPDAEMPEQPESIFD